MNNPDLIFLDEPTTGLDPQVRKSNADRRVPQRETDDPPHDALYRRSRATCRVAIIDQGKIIAMGSPREIQQQTLGQSCIEVLTTQPMPIEVPRFQDSEKHTSRRRQAADSVFDLAKTLTDLVRWIDQMVWNSRIFI